MLKIDLFGSKVEENIPFVAVNNNCREQPHPCYVKGMLFWLSFFFPPSAGIKTVVGFSPVCVSERRG